MHGALQMDRAAMQLDKGAHQRQPKTHAVLLYLRVRALKLAPHPCLIGRRNAHARIGHSDDNLLIVSGCMQRDNAARRGLLNGIRQQIENGLLDPLFIDMKLTKMAG